MIIIERKRQDIVLTVNILSPKQNQVSTGKIRNPVPDPINLAAQTDSVAPAIILHAYQKSILVGTPNTKAASAGLSSHHFQIYCEFN
tara:strand:+ start:286 stop:546 length:261 start_codon:yes stop_codon:yes gene_type:complete